MQNEFVRPKWTPYWVPEATRRIPTIRHLIEKCRAMAVPVIFTSFAASHHNLDRPSSGANMPNRFPGILRDPEWFRDGMICDELARQRMKLSYTKVLTALSSTRRLRRF